MYERYLADHHAGRDPGGWSVFVARPVRPVPAELTRHHRGDAAFYSGAFFALLKARRIEHVIAARVTRRLARRLIALGYGAVAPHIEVGELNHQFIGWGEARRRAVIRTETHRARTLVPICTMWEHPSDRREGGSR